MSPRTIEDLELHKPDMFGDKILAFYSKKPKDYAVYRTSSRVMVQFSDDAERNAAQRRSFAALNPLRGEVNGCIDGWRAARGRWGGRQRAERYDRRVGDALGVGLEDDIQSAQDLLVAIKNDIVAERTSWARLEYLCAAFAMGFVAVLVLMASARWTPLDEAKKLWWAAGAGAGGAFFSIAIGIRGRTVLTDLHRLANNTDAVLRMVIGIIAAAVLMAFVASGAVSIQIDHLSLQDATGRAVPPPVSSGAVPDAKAQSQSNPAPGGAADQPEAQNRADAAASNPNGATEIRARPGQEWLFVLIVGFIAGFSERLVPDLLARTGLVTAPDPPKLPVPRDKKPAAGDLAEDLKKETPAVAAAAAAAAGPEIDPLPDEALADHCACDIGDDAASPTPDAALPPATGGVAAPNSGAPR